MSDRGTRAQKKTAAAALVAAAVAIATPTIMHWEGKRNVTYLDIVGVPTACYGNTAKAGAPGTRWTDEQCNVLLDEDVRSHLNGVLACTPSLGDRPYQLAAANSLAFNIGVAGYCRSTVAKRFNTGDYRGGCDAFRMWVMAGGKRVQGLVNRREDERALCLRGMA